MWYGRLATTLNGGATRSASSWSSASPSMRRRPLVGELGLEALAQVRRRARRSSSTAVTAAPALEQPAGQDARGPARSRARAGRAPARPRRGWPGGRPGRRGSSATGACRAPEARRAEGPADLERIDDAARAVGPSALAAAPRAAATAAPRGRGSARSPRREPPPAGGADHRPVVRAQPRPRHDERHAERLGLAREPRRGARRSPPRRRRARSMRAPVASRGPDRLRDEHVDDGILEAPRELGRRPRRGSGSSAVRRRPSSARAASTIRRAAVFRPREAEVERVAEPGARERRVVAASLPRPPSGSPGRPG